MAITRMTRTGALIGLGLGMATGAHAQGVIKFGGAPAVAYDGRAASAQIARRAESDTQMPGVNRAIMAPVTPAESEQAVLRRTPGTLNVGVPKQTANTRIAAASRVTGDAAATGPASIAELARALRGDPDLIYEYVRNNIEYVPTWGIVKGEFGTLLDNQGTAFDQAALMIALLRQSGYTASFVKGRINLTAAQVGDWLGVDTTNVCAVLNLLGGAQIPVASVTATAAGSCPGSTAALYSLKVDHVWVKATINGSTYYFDPSYKPHVRKAGINLAAATGYNAASFMSGATSGATITSDYVQGLNRANVRASLAGYAGNLAGYLRANLPAATLDDVIGGMTIKPHDGSALRQTVLPYQDTSVALTEWTDVPANYKPTLRVQYQGIDRTFTSDAIYGKRLTLTYNASNQPVLSLDGTALATGTATTPGNYGTVTMTVTHGAYANTGANQNFTQQIKAGGTFLIGNGWGPAGRGTIEQHRSKLDQALASGAAASSEAALGSTLAVLSSSWIGQVNQSDYITDRLARTNTLFHHQVGIAGYNTAAYVDLPGNMLTVVSQDANPAKEAAAFFSDSMHSSIFESTAVQQTTGGSAVSTVKLIDMAVAGNQRIYDARSANFASAVQPNLVGCSGYMASFQSAVAAGRRLILPGSCTLTEGSWTGVGFFNVLASTNSWSIGAIISGGMAGGFATSPLAPTPTNTNTLSNSLSPKTAMPFTGSVFGDPIDMVKGNYLYTQNDLVAGADAFPMSLNFARSYTSGTRTQNGPLGYGWTSGLLSNAVVRSDGFQGMGEDSALDAVAAVAEKLVSLDLLTDTNKPVANMVLATLGQRWFGEQITNNTVAVKQGMNGEIFVKLPDGTFNSPPGSAAKLQSSGAGYTYQTLNRARLTYDATGNLTTYDHPDGVQVKYTYTNGQLARVENSIGRALTLGYTGNRITSVSDGIRTVRYAYDASGNLQTATDALSQSTTYQYDLPGRMTKIFYPSNPTIAAVTNVYDTLGRVQTQTNALGKVFTYYFAGSRSEEAGPYGQRRVSYLDANGKTVRAIDPLGRVDVNVYDGQTRLVSTTLPEKNQIAYTYDDATCASQGVCTHNVKTVRHIPKPGSGLPVLTDSYTYESTFNKLASATNPLSKVTTYTYTAQGNPLTVTSPADASGMAPTTTYGYTAFTVAGFPTFYLQSSTTSKISSTNSLVSTVAYDATNRYVPKTSALDPGGLNLTTTYTYDAVGNLTRIDGPRTDVADVSTFAYDANRQPVQLTNALGKLTKQAYNADGRLIRTAVQAGTQWLVSCNSYSPSGKLLRRWGPSTMAADTACPNAAAPVGVTDYAYDDLDRNVRVTENLPAAEGGNRITDTAYYLDGKVQSITRDAGGALAQVYARYTYTPNGQLATLTDAAGNVTTYVYDGHERKVKVQYPDKVTRGVSSTTDVEQFAYNDLGNLATYVKRNGESMSIAYDALGRVVGRTYPNAADNVVFGYDLLSRQISAGYANGSHTVSATFDNASRLTATSAGGRTLAYQYDQAGNRVRTTWPDAAFYVTVGYDALNRPTSILEQGSALLASYGYDDLSRRTTLTFGNGTSTSYAYDAQGELGSLGINLAGTAQDNTWTFARNQVRELAATSWSNDLYQWKGAANGTRNYAANGLNQYASVAGTALGYDANGNLTGDGTWTYAYDGDNRLKSASRAGLTASLAYDALGRLRRTVVQGATTDLLYAGTQLMAEYDGTGTLVRRYVHGVGVDAPLVRYNGAGTAAKTWLYADALGSIVAEADGTGTAGATYAYGPFGEPSAASGNRFGYTGQFYLGDLGLSYYKARFYSPSLGRFLQTDPVGTVDGLNQYAYVGNNPVNRTDPSGAIAETAWDVFNLAIGGASLAYNLSNGHYGWAAVDAIGLTYDGIATAIPFLPAGASAGLKAYRGGRSVANSIAVGSDVAKVSKAADTIAKGASTTERAMTEGTRIHRAVDDAVNLSSSATSYLRGANGRTGIKPDVVWNDVAGAGGLWADLTTAAQWGAHVRKYESGFGEGIPILYERGTGIVDALKLRSGGSSVLGLSELLFECTR